jgi:tRNA(fMet)-specific endonuclease VapC
MIFIDTNIAIALRDMHRETFERIVELPEVPVLSMITRIELENGANAEPGLENKRRRLLDRLLETYAVEMFTHADILAYGAIVYEFSYNRGLTLDRLIAAQAIARDATLITRNGKDFRKIENLRLIEWETPVP